jgi:hypothetical protein
MMGFGTAGALFSEAVRGICSLASFSFDSSLSGELESLEMALLFSNNQHFFSISHHFFF